MRVLRAKAARKALHFYKVTHGIRDPYTLLVDGTFVHHALVGVKTNLASRVEKVLGRDVRYAVPGPVLDDLRNRGDAGAAALAAALRANRTLRVLEFNNNLVAARGVKALADVPQRKRLLSRPQTRGPMKTEPKLGEKEIMLRPLTEDDE